MLKLRFANRILFDLSKNRMPKEVGSKALRTHKLRTFTFVTKGDLHGHYYCQQCHYVGPYFKKFYMTTNDSEKKL